MESLKTSLKTLKYEELFTYMKKVKELKKKNEEHNDSYIKEIDVTKVNEFIKDVTAWEDVYELLIEADALISDYSSLIFEMGFLNKPVFLFVDDFEQYKKEHGVYMELGRKI